MRETCDFLFLKNQQVAIFPFVAPRVHNPAGRPGAL
jgi:hypothetical protein